MSRSKKSALRVESLEGRELMTATATLTDGLLQVSGTALGETITVRQTATAITVDGVTGSFNPADVAEVWVWGGDGDDVVRLHQTGQEVTRPTVVFGGSGNDTLWGGKGKDFLDGCVGNDTAFGFEGNDFLAGDVGNDYLYGGVGNDKLAGGAGNDNLNGDAGNDSLVGGAGNDALIGGSDFDFLYDPDASTVVVDSDAGYLSSRPAFAWFDDSLADVTLRTYGRAAYRDGDIDRPEMIDLLRRAGDGGVGTLEFSDLFRLTSATELVMPEAVRNLGKKVVSGNPANQWWTGGTTERVPLGNLTAGSTESHMDRLIDKWFLGKDRPEAATHADPNVHYAYRYAEGTLFRNGAGKEDVDQGAIGDCYFMAALGAAAETNDAVLTDMFIDNQDGTFTVRFFKADGTKDFVTVDRYLPTNANGYFVFANNSSGKVSSDPTNELWAALAEKAYAQINESGWIGQDGTNSYNGTGADGSDGINGGGFAAMEQVMGADVATHALSSKAALISAIQANQAIAAATFGETTAGVVGHHMYTVTGYNATTDKFVLYNPWGGANATIELSWADLVANFGSWGEVTI